MCVPYGQGMNSQGYHPWVAYAFFTFSTGKHLFKYICASMCNHVHFVALTAERVRHE